MSEALTNLKLQCEECGNERRVRVGESIPATNCPSCQKPVTIINLDPFHVMVKRWEELE